ncbi:MAG: RNA polymerase subunit sigma-70, partial [Calditrichia bacterium]|nr:RNA polymerase subunit sigma-70 [Calditrichia bacterium]
MKKRITKINPESWVEQHGDYLFYYAVSRVNNKTAAEDLVQETFLSALKNYKNFKQKSS